MYEELVKRLRYAASYDERIVIQDCKEAADAIEGLLAYCDNYEDGLKDAVKELCERDWIPVTERLPECGEDVLCYCRASICEVMKLQTGGTWECDGVVYMSEFVTHWMKLPEPPTEVK